MGRGTPVYYDMEAYHGHRRCKVTRPWPSWTPGPGAARHGYSSGVYSSASSGAENLGWAHRVNGHAIAKPDSMWFGLGTTSRTCGACRTCCGAGGGGRGGSSSTRARTGAGWAGTTLDIDSDWVYGAVYR